MPSGIKKNCSNAKNGDVVEALGAHIVIFGDICRKQKKGCKRTFTAKAKGRRQKKINLSKLG